MPFLRFTRDKRGYETTSLVHAIRRSGRSRQRILYWFRTPPGVKVGRPALDEDAIRWIEEHNPDIEFDWPKILEARPPVEAPVDEGRNRRGRRDRAEPRRKPRPRPEPETSTRRVTADAGPAELDPAPGETDEPGIEAESGIEVESGIDTEIEADAVAEVGDEGAAEPVSYEALAEAFEQLTHPEAEQKLEPHATPVEQTIGPEQLTRLRARFAELQARITERGGNAERIEALKVQAEPLNPDTWVTQEEVRQGVQTFESRIRDLRAALGLRRRRRSRRGSRRRGGGGAPPGQTSPGTSE